MLTPNPDAATRRRGLLHTYFFNNVKDFAMSFWDDLEHFDPYTADPHFCWALLEMERERYLRIQDGKTIPLPKLLSDYRRQHIRWLWAGRIPLGELTIWDGDPSTNKSSLAMDLAARVSTGRKMPDGTGGKKGGVVMLQAEDSIRKTLLARAEAAGADLRRIAVIEWRGERNYSARELLGAARNDGHARDEAVRFLADALADGAIEQRNLLEMAAARGLSQRTLERVKAELGVVSHRKGFGPGSSVYWELPSSEPGLQPTEHTPPTTHLAVYAPEEAEDFVAEPDRSSASRRRGLPVEAEPAK